MKFRGMISSWKMMWPKAAANNMKHQMAMSALVIGKRESNFETGRLN